MASPSAQVGPRAAYEERIRNDELALARLDRIGAGLANERGPASSCSFLPFVAREGFLRAAALVLWALLLLPSGCAHANRPESNPLIVQINPALKMYSENTNPVSFVLYRNRMVICRSWCVRDRLLYRAGWLKDVDFDDLRRELIDTGVLRLNGQRGEQLLPGMPPTRLVIENEDTVYRSDLVVGMLYAKKLGCPDAPMPRRRLQLLAAGSRLYVLRRFFRGLACD